MVRFWEDYSELPGDAYFEKVGVQIGTQRQAIDDKIEAEQDKVLEAIDAASKAMEAFLECPHHEERNDILDAEGEFGFLMTVAAHDEIRAWPEGEPDKPELYVGLDMFRDGAYGRGGLKVGVTVAEAVALGLEILNAETKDGDMSPLEIATEWVAAMDSSIADLISARDELAAKYGISSEPEN